MRAVLRRQSPTCLERALVLQRWHAAHGDDFDVIVGVTGTAEEFRAHAWLENEEREQVGLEAFRELRRLKAR